MAPPTTTPATALRRVVGLQNSLKWFDKVLSGYDELVEEDKRMAAVCEAFRKALAKG